METIREIYFKLKVKTELPVARLNYIMRDNNGYQFTNLDISYHNDEESIEKMERVASQENFHCFMNSEAGHKFYEENFEAIKQSYTNMVLCNAGYGEKICKN